MSMTPKEALQVLVDNIDQARLKELSNSDKYWTKIEEITEATNILKQALKELERLKKFKETFDNYELLEKQGFIAYENWQECERELIELKRIIERLDTARENKGE